MKPSSIFLLLCLFSLSFCTPETKKETTDQNRSIPDSLQVNPDTIVADTLPKEIIIEKELLYDKHTLDDIYPYKDTTRHFQWDKIRDGLAFLEKIQAKPARWAILRNYRNQNGEAPLVKTYKRDSYKRIADTLGIERFQSIPLYALTDTGVPERYGRDGSLVKFLEEGPNFVKAETLYTPGRWMIPKRYIREIPDTVSFTKAIFIDRTNQNIVTLEKDSSKWLVRSMNPATTGLHRPPYAQETPLGIFVLQEKKEKMIYLVDGSKETGGFAPYANRFTNGGYIHGVPVNAPRKSLIEFSPSLGTTPRSHMCVRNATSHAKFIYDWGPVNETIIFVLE